MLYSPTAKGFSQPSPPPQIDQSPSPPPSPPSNGETSLVSFPNHMGMELTVHVDPHFLITSVTCEPQQLVCRSSPRLSPLGLRLLRTPSLIARVPQFYLLFASIYWGGLGMRLWNTQSHSYSLEQRGFLTVSSINFNCESQS